MNLNNFYTLKSFPLNLYNKNLSYGAKIYLVFLHVRFNMSKKVYLKINKKNPTPLTQCRIQKGIYEIRSRSYRKTAIKHKAR